MKWIEATVAFEHADKDLVADLISSIFFDFNLHGVVVQDPELEPAEDWAQDAVNVPAAAAVIGYFPKDRRAKDRLKVLAARLAKLRDDLAVSYSISYRERDEEDWSESWKRYFWPQKIGRRMVVKPSWRDYQGAPDDIVIELDPGMAFGTGTHPTTVLCVEMIETYLKAGDSLLDIGTGSGILMIAAAKLGARTVCGVDNDAVAVEVAKKNLERNGIAAHRYTVKRGQLMQGINRSYDVVVVNILLRVVLDLLDTLGDVMKQSGLLICSGFLESNRQRVCAKLRKIGFEVIESRTKEQWAAICSRFAVPKVQANGHNFETVPQRHKSDSYV